MGVPAVYCIGALSFVYFWYTHFFIFHRVEPNECIEFTENPLYRELVLDNHDARIKASGVPDIYRRYRLVHVFPQKHWGYEEPPPPLETAWDYAPVLFVPGHSGSYNQSKTIAAQLQAEAGSTRISIFALDFQEDQSALSGYFLQAQSEFVNDCVQHILKKCKERARGSGATGAPSSPSSVLVLGHSMGGIAARGALVAKNHIDGTILTVITFNTPHQAISPIMSESKILQFYETLQTAWAQKTGLSKDNLIVVSIAGGRRDTTIRSDLTSLSKAVEAKNSLHVYSSAIPGVWIQNDHDSIMWCGQLIVVVSNMLLGLLDSSGQFMGSISGRMKVLKASLKGQGSYDQLFNRRYRDSMPGAVGSVVRKDHPDTHYLYDLSALRPPSCLPKHQKHEDSTGAFIMLTNVSTPRKDLHISFCKTLDCEISSCVPVDMDHRVDFLPYGDRRHHLHHSYDPKMKPGERHRHRWSRATKEELFSNAGTFKYGGSLSYVFAGREEMKDYGAVSIEFGGPLAKDGHNFLLAQYIPENSQKDAPSGGEGIHYIPKDHPAVCDISSIAKNYYGRLAPIVLKVEKLSCENVGLVNDAGSPGEFSQNFKPILRTGFYEGATWVEESIYSARPLFEGSPELPRTSTFFVQGNQYNTGTKISVQLLSDPRCSYRLIFLTDWESILPIFCRLVFPRFFSGPFAVCILIFAAQLWVWKGKNGDEVGQKKPKRFLKFPSIMSICDVPFVLRLNGYCMLVSSLKWLLLRCFPSLVDTLQRELERPTSVPAEGLLSVNMNVSITVLSVGILLMFYMLIRLFQSFLVVCMLACMLATQRQKKYYNPTGSNDDSWFQNCRPRKRSRSNIDEESDDSDEYVSGELESNSHKDFSAAVSRQSMLKSTARVMLLLLLLLLWPILTIACLVSIRVIRQPYGHVLSYGGGVLSISRVDTVFVTGKAVFETAVSYFKHAGDNSLEQMLVLLHVMLLGTQSTSLMLDFGLLLSPHEIPTNSIHAFMLLPSAIFLLAGQVNLHDLDFALSWKLVAGAGTVTWALLLDRLDAMYLVVALIFTPSLYKIIVARRK